MRKIVFAGLCLCYSGCGLLAPTTTSGWHFEWLRPPTVSAPAVVSTGGPPLGLAGVGAGQTGMAPVTRAFASPACEPCQAPTAGPGGGLPRLAATGDACTLDEICRRLDRIEAKQNNALPPPRPLPMGPANP